MFAEFIQKIEKSEDFKNWMENKKSQTIFLTNIFIMKMPDNNILQAGYYDSDSDKMTTISIKEDSSLEISEESEVFKKPETVLVPLEINKVNLSYEKIKEIAEAKLKECYPKESSKKEIVILQKTSAGTKKEIIYNITFITDSFCVINMKIDAENGEIISHEKKSIIEFKSDE